MFDNIIQINQNFIHTKSKDLVKTGTREALNDMLDAGTDKLVNADHYVNDEKRKN